ncbi:MAG: caspase family protein [Leptospiraceae bacterium]|nr:caspase family protein [Leptospiraceae bacterium]
MSSKNALVIGVSAYEHISPLTNTVNDAEDIAKTLRKLGFAVMLETNPTLTEFEDALENFATSIQYNKDVALFYYSGHGIQVDGKNYLIPKNAELDRETRIKRQTIDLEEVTLKVSEARNELNIFILDACRDNPFAGKFRSVNRGLAEIKKMPPSTYFAYAAAAGQTASDGIEGARNGIFTESFLKVLEEYSSEEIDMIFRKTRSSVLKKTKNVQEPWTNHNLSERHYLIESIVETHGGASTQEQKIPSTPIVETPLPTVGIGRDRSEILNDQPVNNTKKWRIIAVAAIVLSVVGWFGYQQIDLMSKKNTCEKEGRAWNGIICHEKPESTGILEIKTTTEPTKSATNTGLTQEQKEQASIAAEKRAQELAAKKQSCEDNGDTWTGSRCKNKTVTPSGGTKAVGLTWSAYQGAMNWHNAKSKCAGLGMRLPTKDELVALYKSGASWRNAGCSDGICAYWSSTEYSAEGAYTVSMNSGSVSSYGKDHSYNDVRCVR